MRYFRLFVSDPDPSTVGPLAEYHALAVGPGEYILNTNDSSERVEAQVGLMATVNALEITAEEFEKDSRERGGYFAPIPE